MPEFVQPRKGATSSFDNSTNDYQFLRHAKSNRDINTKNEGQTAALQSYITSSKFSVYTIPEKPELHTYFRLNIEARDAMNMRKLRGGDFWSVVMSSLSLNVNLSTSAEVIDHENGTYSSWLYAGWPGKAKITVKLVHPRQAVQYLRSITDNVNTSNQYWNTTFTNGNQSDFSLCYMDFSGPPFGKNKCIYTYEKALGNMTAKVCEKPRNGLACNTAVSYTGAPSVSTVKTREMMHSGNKTWLFKGYNIRFLFFLSLSHPFS